MRVRFPGGASLEPTKQVQERVPAAVRPRVTIVVSHPIQHFGPMYRSIAADARVELLVIFTDSGSGPRFDPGFGRVVQWQEDLLEGYPFVLLEGSTAEERRAALIRELERFSPDVVYVHGYVPRPCRDAMQWANRRRIPVMMTTDSELLHRRPWHVRAMKRLALPPVLRRVSLFLTVGDENERYFRHYGVPQERFHRVPFSIDSQHYDRVLREQPDARASLRRELGLPDDALAVLTVGKLIPRKRQEDLIQAFRLLKERGCRSGVLLIAGDGPERARLEEMARPLGAAVRFLGFIGVTDLPRYYRAADLYAHPSDFDPHPLAISEAIYCGLPVIVSDRIGSAGPTDDVQAGRNGWVYPVGDAEKLAGVLERTISDREWRRSAAEISRELGRLHAADRCAKLFVDGALRVPGDQAGKPRSTR